MKRRFALPVTMALSIEAVALLCFNNPVPASGTPVVKPAAPLPPAWQPDDPPPVDITAAAASSVEQHANASAKPVLPEPPPIPADDAVTIKMPLAPSHPQLPSSDVSVIAPGGPAGSVDSIGSVGPDQLDNAPSARVQRPPRFPYEAVRNRKDGEVVVEFSVDERGRVYGARVVSSTDTVFEEPTLQAVGHWRFEPGRRNGRAVRFHMMVPVEFRVDSD